MTGEFDEDKHPRGDDGKFSSGGSGGSSAGKHADAKTALTDREFVAEHGQRLNDAYENARFGHDESGSYRELPRGSDAHHEAGVKAQHQEAENIIGEHAARKAGLVPALPEHVQRARDAVAAGNKAVADTMADMEPEHKAAIKAAYELGALRSEEHGIGDDILDADELHRTLDDGIDEAGGKRHDAPEVDGHGSDLDKLESHAAEVDEDGNPVEFNDDERPDRVQYDDGEQGDAEYKRDLEAHETAKSEHEKNAADYKAVRDRMQARFDAKAEETQSALEALHAKQVSALDKMKAEEKKVDASGDDDSGDDDDVFHEHFAAKIGGKARFDEDSGQWDDPHTQALYEHAGRAYDHDLARARESVGDFKGGEDAQGYLKESIRETAATIKHLSKYTGRPAKLAGAKPKAGKTKKSVDDGAMSDGSELVCVAFLDA